MEDLRNNKSGLTAADQIEAAKAAAKAERKQVKRAEKERRKLEKKKRKILEKQRQINEVFLFFGIWPFKGVGVGNYLTVELFYQLILCNILQLG